MSSNIPYNYFLSGQFEQLFDFTDKKKAVGYYVGYMLNRTRNIFRYANLPESIPERMLELYLQSNGNVCITDIECTLYAFVGAMGGKPNPYYMPTIYTIANPALGITKNLKIDDECIVIPNDTLYMGLLPMYSKYATLLVENDISMRMVDINSRIASLIISDDDKGKASAELYLKQLEDGKLGIIGESAFLDGVKTQPYGNSPSGRGMTELIEYEQYLKASWFNDIGIQANYNMKRESINSNEAQLNEDYLLPYIDDMMNQRQLGIDKVNEKYGTNITIEFNSSWEQLEDEPDE